MEGRFPATVQWSGSTSTRTYRRDASGHAPGKAEIPLSAGDPTIGDPTRWNPEDLFALSLGTCHMLTFLALAAKVGIDVLDYDGRAEAIMQTVDHVTSVGTVRLFPRITVAPGADLAKAAVMFEKAHRYCYIANSVRCEVVMEPEFVTAG